MDADQSHDPDALPSFLAEMEKGRDLVIGSRYLNATISVVGWILKGLYCRNPAIIMLVDTRLNYPI